MYEERQSLVVRGLSALLAIVIMTGMPEEIEMPEINIGKVNTHTVTIETETHIETEGITVEPTTENVVAKPNETETATETETVFFDVPLPKDVQLHIFAECKKYNIAPAIVIAIIEKESSYRPYIIGDNGESFGYMQIKEKYQKERMERLGVTDLLDPFQNITVGVDILAELISENEDVYWVLMAYNGGRSYANKMVKADKISNYATYVTERAWELEREYYKE